MSSPIERRAFRPESDPRDNPEAVERERAWKRVRALYDELRKRSSDPIQTSVAINAFVEELRHVYAEEELRTYRAYNLLCNSAESGPNLDFPDDRIQHFLDDLLLKEINKVERKRA